MVELYEPRKVLDKGFVRLVQHCGSDQMIVDAARVSYQGGTTKKNTAAGLIDYLMRHKHMTPFEMTDFTFHVKMPIFVARQWHRHRTASINEISARYSVIKDEFYVPTVERFAAQSKNNKQGSGNGYAKREAQWMVDAFQSASVDAFNIYNWVLNRFDLARELARIILPQSAYTEFYWKVNGRNLMNFLQLRGPEDGHAQAEIQLYATEMRQVFAEILPLTNEAFEEHVLFAMTLSRREVEALQANVHISQAIKDASQVYPEMTGGRLTEFVKKMDRFKG
jgi:thymidylate synthase (FAD)